MDAIALRDAITRLRDEAEDKKAEDKSTTQTKEFGISSEHSFEKDTGSSGLWAQLLWAAKRSLAHLINRRTAEMR